MSLTDYLASIKVEDIEKSIISPTNSKILNEFRSLDHQNPTSLTDFLSSISSDIPNNEVDERKSMDSDSSDDGESDEDEEENNEVEDNNEEPLTEETGEEDAREEAKESSRKVGGGRRANSDLKQDALMAPFIDVANSLTRPCNNTCPLQGKCTQNIPLKIVMDERIIFLILSINLRLLIARKRQKY